MSTAKKVWLVLGAVGLLVCGGGSFIILQFVDFPQAANRLPQVEKRAVAAGVPMTAQELLGPLPMDDGSLANAAMANDHLKSSISQDLKAAESSNPDWKQAQKTLSDYGKDLNFAKALSDLPVTTLDLDYDLGADALFPHFAQLKYKSRLLCLAALVHAHQGKFEESAHELARVRKIGTMAARVPNLIGLLVRLSIDAILYDAAQNCVALAVNSPSGLAEFQSCDLVGDLPYDIDLSFRGEAFCAVTTCRNFKKLGNPGGVTSPSPTYVPPDPKSLKRSGMPTGTLARAYMARSLEYWALVFEERKKHPGDLLANGRFMDRLRDDMDSRKGLSYWVANAFLPSGVQTAKSVLGGQARQRTYAALIKVLEFRQKSKRFPKTLDEAGVTLKDPFDGSPLRYSVKDGQARVWSLGADGVDNGGSPVNVAPSGKDKLFDIVAAYPPVFKSTGSDKAKT